MMNLNETGQPGETELLIVFADLTNFSRLSMKRSSLETFSHLSRIYEMTCDQVEAADGAVIKFIGDESLSIFPANRIDKGITAMLKLKKDVDSDNRRNGIDSQLKVRCHFGKPLLGLIGGRSDKRPDVIGNDVNICAMLRSNGFVMTAETFRKLKPETRTLFKKHTPAITYIPLDEAHKD